MIKDIKELNFPSYATLSQATVNIADMGEKTISAQIKIDGNIAPDFSKDWEVEFKGEKYIMPLRQPQASKDNTSLNSSIDLTFQHWAIYQLKRWYFFTLQPVETGTAIPDKYIAPVSLNLKDFCALFNQVLEYYFSGDISINLNPEWESNVEPTSIEINNSYLWDILIKFYELYATRWEIVPEPNLIRLNSSDWYVKSFSESSAIGTKWENTEYSSSRWLRHRRLIPCRNKVTIEASTGTVISFMQFDENGGYLGKATYHGVISFTDEETLKTLDLDPRTCSIGLILTKTGISNINLGILDDINLNITSEGNARYIIDVGYSATELSHVFEYGFEGGLLKVERQVQDENIRNMLLGRGGDQNLPYRYFKNVDPQNPSFLADPDWIPELKNIYFNELRGATFRSYVQGWKAKHYNGTVTKEQSYVKWAWEKGYTDAKFNPVEYVKDDISIARYGELMGGLENNEDIYPSIQGVVVDPYGRVDQVVAVEDILSDELSPIEVDSYKINLYEDNDGVYAQHDTITAGQHATLRTAKSGWFTIPQNYYANISSGDTTKIVRAHGTGADCAQYIVFDSDPQIKVFDETGKEYPASGLPAGTYQYQVVYNIQNTYPGTVRVVSIASKVWAEVNVVNDYHDDRVFNIWIKNIWSDSRLDGESDAQYADRVWRPILGDRLGNEAKVIFSSGFLSISEDYEFIIIKMPEYDESKTYEEKDSDNNVLATYTSYWKLTLKKSDAEYDATGLLLPNTKINAHAGDYFFFVGIDMPHQYVLWAEQRLTDYKIDELAKVSEIKPTWVVSLDKIRIANQLNSDTDALINQLAVGSSLRLADKRFIDGVYETLYLQSITYTYNQEDGGASIIPNIEIVLSDEYATSASPVATLQGEVSALQKQVGAISNIEQIVRAVGDRLYLRKDGISDYSNSPTTFNKSVVIGDSAMTRDYREGGMTGSGLRFGHDENGDSIVVADKVMIRKQAIFNEVIINQISFTLGATVFSNGGCEITDVQEMADAYRCYYDNKDGKRYSGLVVNDQVRCQRYSPTQNSIVKYYWRLVVAVGDNYIDLSKTDADGADIPAIGDNIVQLGHRTDITRQRAIVIDPLSGIVEVYAHISSYTLTERNYTGMGVNPQTGEPYMYGYGDIFFGDRDLSDPSAQYITFQKKTGDNRRKLHINAAINIGAGSTGLSNLSEWPEKQTEIDNANAAVNDLNSYVDGAFKDGVISESEAIAIEKYKNSVNETKKSVDASYTTVYGNALLIGSAKSNLAAAKSAFDTATTNLLNSITAAISDGKTTTAEKTDVDTKYATFNTAYGTYTTRLDEARKAIENAINDTANSAKTLANSLQTLYNNLNDTIIPDLQNQIDGAIESWNGAAIPTLTNAPASNWTTATEKDRHIGDYYDREITSNGETSYERYKFTKTGSTYEWKLIADDGGAKALAEAQKALGIANGKNKVFYQTATPSAPYKVDDLWIKTDTGVMYISTVERADGATVGANDWTIVNDTAIRLRQMSSDNVISKEEKAALRNEWAQIQKEYISYQSDATTYGVSITALTNAYNTLANVLTGTAAIASDSDITLTTAQRTSFNNAFASWQSEVSRFANAVAQKKVDTAVDDLEIGGANYINGTNQGVRYWTIYLQSEDHWTKEETELLGVRACKMSVNQMITTPKLFLFRNGATAETMAEVYMYDAIKVGDNVIISFDADTTNINYIRMAFAATSGANNAITTTKQYIYPQNDGIAHYEWHGVANANWELKKQCVYMHITPKDATAPVSITIANLKLEKGTKSTPWIPSQVDRQTEIDDIRNSLEGTMRPSDIEWLTSQFNKESTDIANGLILSSFIGTRINEKVVAAITNGASYPFLFAGCKQIGTNDETKANSAFYVDENGNIELQDMSNSDTTTRNKMSLSSGRMQFYKGSDLQFEQTPKPANSLPNPLPNMLFTQFGVGTSENTSVSIPSKKELLSLSPVSTSILLASIQVKDSYGSLGTTSSGTANICCTVKCAGTGWNTVSLACHIEIRNSVGDVLRASGNVVLSSTTASVSIPNISPTSDYPTNDTYNLYLVVSGTYTTTSSPEELINTSLAITPYLLAKFVCNNNTTLSNYPSRIFGNGVFYAKSGTNYLGLICDETGGLMELRSYLNSTRSSGIRSTYDGNFRWSRLLQRWIPIDNVIFRGKVGHADSTTSGLTHERHTQTGGFLNVSYVANMYSFSFPSAITSIAEFSASVYMVRITPMPVSGISTYLSACIFQQSKTNFSVKTFVGTTVTKGMFYYEVVLLPQTLNSSSNIIIY